MPYCSKCGKEVPKEATFCPNCGTPIELTAKNETIVLATWEARALAWLIDILIVGAFVALLNLRGLLLVPFDVPRWIPFVDLGPGNLVYFLYWMLMDGLYGQSLGRMIMNIKITSADGKPTNMGQAAIESAGKAFFLLIDFLVGYFLYPRKKQRILNYLSNTIVVCK
jgi:uncharacterized RDD family membrane protein YckC